VPKDHYDNSQNHDTHDTPQDDERLCDLTQTRHDGIRRGRDHLVNVPACSVSARSKLTRSSGDQANLSRGSISPGPDHSHVVKIRPERGCTRHPDHLIDAEHYRVLARRCPARSANRSPGKLSDQVWLEGRLTVEIID